MNYSKNNDNEIDQTPDNEFKGSVPHDPEIEQPNPSTATPDIPQEMPIRQG